MLSPVISYVSKNPEFRIIDATLFPEPDTLISLPNPFGITGNNLLLWTKEFKYSDPDKGSDNLNSPSMRYIGFNLKTSFYVLALMVVVLYDYEIL